MSGVFRQQLCLRSSDTDEFRRLRMSALFRFLQEISIDHTEALGAGREKTLDRGALWVMTRMRVQADRLPEYGESITLESWAGETMHVVFPRYYRILDHAGAPICQASGMWVLMDRSERGMVFPDSLGVVVPGYARGDELPLPEALALPEFDGEIERAVRYSEIDLNGHVNNTRYLEWLDDLFPREHHAAHFWRELQVNYLAEIPPDSTVHINTRIKQNPCCVQGCVNGKPVFQILAKY